MDSIFQIKINENKLQVILNNFQSVQCEQDKKLNQLESKVCKINEQISEQHNNVKNYIGEQIRKSQQQIYNKISQQYEVFDDKLRAESQVWAQKVNNLGDHMKQIEEELEDKVQQMDKFQECIEKMDDNYLKLSQKVQQIQQEYLNAPQKIEKTISSTKYLQNQDFHHFIQILIDKQIGQKLPQFQKQYKNPFDVLNEEERQKRFKQLKRSILETQKQVNKVNVNLGDLRATTSEESRSNRQQIHLHYAFLSSKIKQLQKKYESQNNFIKSKYPQLDSVVYTSGHPKYHGKKNPTRFNSVTANDYDHFLNNINFKGTMPQNIEIQLTNLKDDLQKKEFFNSQKIKDLIEKLEEMNIKINNIQIQHQILNKNDQEKNYRLKRNSRYRKNSKQQSFSYGVSYLAMRKMEQSFQEQIGKKLQISVFQSEMQEIKQKILHQSQAFNDKANRKQTREAFLFMEGKIKQIVTILADMQNNSKKNVAGRKMFQCISCDDNFFEELSENTNNNPIRTTKTSRPTTNIHRRTASNKVLNLKQNNCFAFSKNKQT